MFANLFGEKIKLKGGCLRHQTADFRQVGGLPSNSTKLQGKILSLKLASQILQVFYRIFWKHKGTNRFFRFQGLGMFIEVVQNLRIFFFALLTLKSPFWKPLCICMKDFILSNSWCAFFKRPETLKTTLALCGSWCHGWHSDLSSKSLKDILGGAIGIPYCSSKKTHTNRLDPWISESFICEEAMEFGSATDLVENCVKA